MSGAFPQNLRNDLPSVMGGVQLVSAMDKERCPLFTVTLGAIDGQDRQRKVHENVHDVCGGGMDSGSCGNSYSSVRRKRETELLFCSVSFCIVWDV